MGWIFFIVITLFFLVPAILQWLWNITMPELFGLTEVTYWQSFRLLLIAGILIGGPGLINFNLGN
ncbi:MAG: hypothetical protein ACRENP_25440 [Longimicrobiales bacterium]